MPIPLALALAPSAISAIGGGVSYLQQQRALGSERSESERLAAEAADAAKKALESMPSYTVGRSAREAYMMSQQDRAGKVAREEIQRQAASGLGAMSAGGAKSLIGGGGASDLAISAARESEMQAERANQRKIAGTQTYAAQEQDALDANKSIQAELAMFDYGRALSQGDVELDRARELGVQQNAARQQITQDLFSAGSGALGLLGQTFANKGAKLKKTPGEFDHDSNPIDLMQGGRKIGEATGGEVIFNPEQTQTIEKMAADGDTDLHKYLRSLFKKFNQKS